MARRGPVKNPKQDREILPRTGNAGNLTAYDREMAFEIVWEIAEGRTLREICSRRSGYCTPATFRRWSLEHADLQRAFKEAQAISAMAFEEEAIDEARTLRTKAVAAVDVAAHRALAEQLRWSAERRDPSTYGQTAKVQIKVPVTINTILDLGQEGAAKGSSETENIYELNAKPIIEVPFEEIVPETISRGGPRKRVLIPRIPMDAATPLRKTYRERHRDDNDPPVSEQRDPTVHWPGFDPQTWEAAQGEPVQTDTESDRESVTDGEELHSGSDQAPGSTDTESESGGGEH